MMTVHVNTCVMAIESKRNIRDSRAPPVIVLKSCRYISWRCPNDKYAWYYLYNPTLWNLKKEVGLDR